MLVCGTTVRVKGDLREDIFARTPPLFAMRLRLSRIAIMKSCASCFLTYLSHPSIQGSRESCKLSCQSPCGRGEQGRKMVG